MLDFFNSVSINAADNVKAAALQSDKESYSSSSVAVCSNGLAAYNAKNADHMALAEDQFKTRTGSSKLEAYSAVGDSSSAEQLLRNKKLSGSKYSREEVDKALLAASSAGSVELVNALLGYINTELGSEKSGKQSALLTAAFCGHVSVVDVLLNAKVSANETDHQGLDAMMISIMGENPQIAKRLVAGGYDSCKNKTAKGQFVKDLAITMNQLEVAAMLNICH